MSAEEEWTRLAVIIEEAKKHPKTEPHFKPLYLKPEDDVKDDEFGLTNEEYLFLLDDIDGAIADANEKWDYSGYVTKPEPKQMFAIGSRISKRSRVKQFLRYQRRV
jgi:hypothetical protein